MSETGRAVDDCKAFLALGIVSALLGSIFLFTHFFSNNLLTLLLLLVGLLIGAVALMFTPRKS